MVDTDIIRGMISPGLPTRRRTCTGITAAAAAAAVAAVCYYISLIIAAREERNYRYISMIEDMLRDRGREKGRLAKTVRNWKRESRDSY
jgi:hypothetical protein